ncbi:MAG: hypothetical protein ABEJ57_03350 [Halobacteriaceae archaeon]
MARSSSYLLAVLGVVVGQAIMLYGVFQTSGEHLNAPMALGGVVVLAAIGVLAGGLFAEDSPA